MEKNPPTKQHFLGSEKSWMDNVGGSFMYTQATSDLLFHLYSRINYAQMLIRNIMDFFPPILSWIIQIFIWCRKTTQTSLFFSAVNMLQIQWGDYCRDIFCVCLCLHYIQFNLFSTVHHHLVARSSAALKRVQSAREKEFSKGGGEEVSLVREVMRPHRHKDDKDTSGWLSSFKSHWASHHTVNPH